MFPFKVIWMAKKNLYPMSPPLMSSKLKKRKKPSTKKKVALRSRLFQPMDGLLQS